MDEPVTPVEILDPWVGPKTYAEDFYSGGDLVAPVAAGLTPNNMTPADMSPIVEAAGDDQDNNPTADFMLPSPSPEIIDVDADEDEPENESLPRSSPPPADAEDEFDELYADIDENCSFLFVDCMSCTNTIIFSRLIPSNKARCPCSTFVWSTPN